MKTSIKELEINLRPRERLKKYGASSLSDDELLAILLRCGSKEANAKDLGIEIIKKMKGLNNIANATLEELSSIKGIGNVKAITLLASVELGKRCLKKNTSNIKINNNYIIYDLFKYEFVNVYQENFICLFLDTKNNLINYDVIFKGTLESAQIHPREIFKLAVKYSAASIILVHNHPSGNATPSNADMEITNKLMDVGNMMGIPVIDHIIIGYNNYYSFYDRKKIEINE